MLFGKKDKKNKEQGDAPPEFEVDTIPEDFYGGQNPVVYRSEQQAAGSSGGQQASKPSSKKTAAAPKKPSPRPPGRPSFFQSKAFLITTGSVVFLAVVGGISWYYISQANQAIPRVSQTTEEPNGSDVEIPIGDSEMPTEIEPAEDTPTTTEIGIATSTEDQVPTSTPSLADQPIEFPSTFLVDSADLDNDDLTDSEEELFGTDTGIPDTDSDGYPDGLEVTNLYNPRGVAPIRLIDSGLVREYVHPFLQYRVYYPAGWEVAAVDPESRQVLLSAASGDFIEIRAVEKDPNTSFVSWFGTHARGQQFSDLEEFMNRFEEEGYRRADGLVSYFVTDRLVYVIVYHPGVTGSVPYRQVVRMVSQSFRPSQTTVRIPDQTTLPEASGDTATSSPPTSTEE